MRVAVGLGLSDRERQGRRAGHRGLPGRDPSKGYAAAHDIAVDPARDKDKVFSSFVAELVEPDRIQPTFLCDYPAIAQPLARAHCNSPA